MPRKPEVVLNVRGCPLRRRRSSLTERDREARRTVLAQARRIARRCALRHRQRLTTAHEVCEALRRAGHAPATIARVAGAIFRGRDWVPTCLRVRRPRPSGQKREIKIWKLLEETERPQVPSELRPTAFLVATHKPRGPFPEEVLRREPPACVSCNRSFPDCTGSYRRGHWVCFECQAIEEGGTMTRRNGNGDGIGDGNEIGDGEQDANRKERREGGS